MAKYCITKVTESYRFRRQIQHVATLTDKARRAMFSKYYGYMPREDHEEVHGAILRTIADWNKCSDDDINSLKQALQCSERMYHEGVLELLGVDFAVFVSVKTILLYFYAVEQGWFIDTGALLSFPFS